MFIRTLLTLSALCFAVTGPAAAQNTNGESETGTARKAAQPSRAETGGQSYGDRNRGGPYGFYSYPNHRHVDGGSGGLDRRPLSSGSAGTSSNYDGAHGSAYYGPNYGAPYFGGGYYDQGTYYRERRDR